MNEKVFIQSRDQRSILRYREFTFRYLLSDFLVTDLFRDLVQLHPFLFSMIDHF